MDFTERLIYLLVGGVVGFVLGYIVARLNYIQDEVEEIMHHEDHHRDEKGISRLRTVVQDAILLGVVLMVAYAAWSAGQSKERLEDNIEADKIALCRAGEEQRAIDRRLVEAVFNLATSTLERPRNSPPLAEEDKVRVNNYIENVNEFRQEMYEQIRPTKICAPFVEDDNVRPSTPPYPPLD